MHASMRVRAIAIVCGRCQMPPGVGPTRPPARLPSPCLPCHQVVDDDLEGLGLDDEAEWRRFQRSLRAGEGGAGTAFSSFLDGDGEDSGTLGRGAGGAAGRRVRRRRLPSAAVVLVQVLPAAPLQMMATGSRRCSSR